MTTLLAATSLALGGGGLISILVWLLIIAIIGYAVFIVVGMFPFPAPIKTLIYLIVGAILLYVLLGHLGVAI